MVNFELSKSKNSKSHSTFLRKRRDNENSEKINFDSEYKFIYLKILNLLMYNGKKKIARKLLEDSLEKAFLKIKEVSKKKILIKAILNLSPDIRLKLRRKGNSFYQIPSPLDFLEKKKLGIRFLLDAARSRNEYKMVDKFGLELIDAYYKKGIGIKKKENLHKLGEKNKSFSHFNW